MGMEAHTCILSTWRWKKNDQESILDYLRPRNNMKKHLSEILP